jgi:serine/threonine protein kinase
VCQVLCKQTQKLKALKLTAYSQRKPSDSAIHLEREYKMLSELDHPNIISVHRQDIYYERYLVMEMELGLETLSQFAARCKLTEEQSARIMRGILQALVYLHDQANVIHRDIKPQNVVLTDYDDLSKVKLIDFGLAVKSTKFDVQDFAKCGTLLYTPPE